MLASFDTTPDERHYSAVHKSPARFSRPLGIQEITPEAVVERLSYRLRQMIGTGRQWSYQGLASRTGIDVRTLKAYVQGTACPNLVKYKRLLAILGPEVGTELNAMKGWLPRSDAVPPEALDLAELRGELSRAADILESVQRPLDGAADPAPGPALPHPSPQLQGTRENADEPSDHAPADTLSEFSLPLKIEEIDNEAVTARLSYRLRLIIGPQGRWKPAEVAEATGIDQRTLQSYLDGAACPNLARFLRLTYFIGPEIGVELARMIGWEPRYSPYLRLSSCDIRNLTLAIRNLQGAIDRIVGAPPCGTGPRLIRRHDRVSEPADEA